MHWFFQQTTEEDPDEGIKDIVELVLKKMVSLKDVVRLFKWTVSSCHTSEVVIGEF